MELPIHSEDKGPDVDDEDIRVIDFGLAFNQEIGTEYNGPVSEMAAPETIFTNQVDHRSDLWAVGLIVRLTHSRL
jgi:hypothetical protein